MQHSGIAVLFGPPAAEALSSSEFESAWRELYAQCPYSTAFQAPEFVRTWYSAYASIWQPAIAVASDPQKGLTGLWFLAVDPRRELIVSAGAHQAEYQTWLTRSEDAASFIGSAWKRLTEQFDVETLRLRYLPSVELADELKHATALTGCVSIRFHQQPLIRLSQEKVRASFAKKSNRSRLNRLKRLGDVQFRRVTTADEFDNAFRHLIKYYDFRQGAINDTSPFFEDARKAHFYGELFRAAPHDVHLSVIYLEDVPISVLWGSISRSAVSVNMIAHSPILAAHSPGKLHLMLLADHLLNEGFESLDLTPGGDAWKGRFATEFGDVAEAVLYRNVHQRWKADLSQSVRTTIKTLATGAGIRTEQLTKLRDAAYRASPAKLSSKARNWAYSCDEYRVYRGTRGMGEGCERDSRVLRNDLSELIKFVPVESWQSRHHFLSGALSRLEQGESVYSISIDGRLAHHGWMARNQVSSHMTEVNLTLTLPQNSVTLYDFYTHPAHRGRGLYRSTIRHMLCDAFADPKTESAYIFVLANDLPSRHVIESLGFEFQESYRRVRNFGLERKYKREAMDPVWIRK